jgi:hypothetical protein
VSGRRGNRTRHRTRPARVPEARITELCERFTSVCESAVDPLEVACGLEFEGINDATAREHYGAEDVFALAETLFARVPRRPSEPDPPVDPWIQGRLRPALHGLLYALPAAFFPAAVGLLTGPYALEMLIVALLTAWTLGQTLAFLGFRRLVPNDSGPARRILRGGLVVGVLLAAGILGGVALDVHANPTVFWFGMGEAAYMLGASVLFVLSKERWVLVALVPGLVSATCFLSLGKPGWLVTANWVLLGATPVLGVSLGLLATGIPRTIAGPGVSIRELRAALPTAAFGLTAAALLSYPAAVGLRGGVNPAVLLATLPISLSMGGAEWSLLWFRRRTLRLLRSTDDPLRFARKARAMFAVAVLQFTAMAVLLIGAAIAVAWSTDLLRIRASDIPQLVAYLLLGVGMFLALSVQAVGLRLFTVAATSCALAFELGFRGLGVPAQLIACGGLVLAVGWYALVELGAVTKHSV